MICKQAAKHIAIGFGIEIACYDGITIGAQLKHFLPNQYGCFFSRLPALMIKVSVQKEDRFALCVLKVSQLNPSCDAWHSRVPAVTNGLYFSYPGYNKILSGFPDPAVKVVSTSKHK
jgi:hypothetical protein